MGKKEKKVKRVVLDTNILISALLFGGELSRIADLWKEGRIVPVVSRETFTELSNVLEYPKFRLTKDEIRVILEEEALPYFEVAGTAGKVSGICADPDDDKFIACALAASVDYIVSGDKALCALGRYKSVRIITATALLEFVD